MKNKFLAGLTTAALVAISVPAQAASLYSGESFGTSGIKFIENTKVNFNFNESHGAYTSSVKVFEVGANNQLTMVKSLFSETKQSDNGSANGWLGSCGNTVLVCTNDFVFEANKTYTLGLDSGNNGIVYTTTALNNFASGGTQQAVFNSFGSLGAADGTTYSAANQAQYQSGDPFANVLKISFDDRGNGNDKDFQDVSLWASASRVAKESVPEPTTLAGLALAGAAITVSRRRRTRTIG
ncbi:MAG TPA: PEP-CTERM sorting domain-containing protein [Leptolyngbyaceae cyanobacterium]